LKELGIAIKDIKREKKIITTQIRPYRIAFIVNRSISKEQLSKLIQFNTHIWGGFYNAFIPTDSYVIQDEWWYMMRLADPDIICLAGGVSEDLMREINEQMSPLIITEWRDEKLDFLMKQGFILDLRTVPIQNILYAKTKHTYIPDKSNILVPLCSKNNALYTYVEAVFGNLSVGFANWYREGLKADTFGFDDKNLSEYLEGYQKSIGLLTPIKLTAMGLKVTVHNTFLDARNVLHVFLAGDKFIDDFCLYWYFRRYIGSGPLFLPLNCLSNDIESLQFKDWLDKTCVHKNIIDFISASLDQKTAAELGTKLERDFGLERIYRIRFRNFDEIEVGGIIITEDNIVTEEVEFVKGKCKIKTRNPISFERRKLTSWIMDIDIQGVKHGNDGYKLPKIKAFAELFSGNQMRFPQRSLKIADEFSFSASVFEDDKFINLELNDSNTLISNLLNKFGYKVELLEVNKYCTGMLKLAGNLNFLKILQDKKVRDLFRAMSKHSIAVNVNEIKRYLKCGKDSKHAEEFITALSIRNILIRGYNIRCPHCDLTQWYPLEKIREKMTCAGCLSHFQIPARLDFHYRLNDLFVRGINDCGVIPVILTLIFLSSISKESFLYLVGAKIKGAIETDVDLIAICDRKIIFSECKDLENIKTGVDTETINEIQEQFKNLYGLSKEMGIKVLLLSTLVEENNKAVIDKLKSKFPPSGIINTRFLCSKDLQKGFFN